MTIASIMQKSVLSVTEKTSIHEVANIIFTKHISGLPVLKGKKLVGIVTEEDILSHLYPTIQDLIEDYAHMHDFDWMEENFHELLSFPVSKIMIKSVKTVTPETHIMKAQAMMLSHSYSRLPVVDKKGHLLGIVSQGDVFRYLLKKELVKKPKKAKN